MKSLDTKPAKEILAYRNERLLSRFMRDHGLDRERSEQAFAQLLEFLLRSGQSAKPLYPPSKLVDEMWHSFILHTSDYHDFCRDYIGGFIHHNPLDPDPILAGSTCTSDQEGSQDEGGGNCSSSGEGFHYSM